MNNINGTPFTIELRSGIPVLVWEGAGCRPATEEEWAMWSAMHPEQGPGAVSVADVNSVIIRLGNLYVQRTGEPRPNNRWDGRVLRTNDGTLWAGFLEHVGEGVGFGGWTDGETVYENLEDLNSEYYDGGE